MGNVFYRCLITIVIMVVGVLFSAFGFYYTNKYSTVKELTEELLRKFGISEFSTKPTNFYTLDMIISIGCRVKSMRGTQFRIWVMERLKEYIVKGFTSDDERLKQGGQKARYFQKRNWKKQSQAKIRLEFQRTPLDSMNPIALPCTTKKPCWRCGLLRDWMRNKHGVINP